MYARVPQAMAQFVLKIEKLSHIMAPTPIPEMARAYGLRPRLWLLLPLNFGTDMKRWVSTFYSNIESTVINNGNRTNRFKPSKGERQGFPPSLYLLLRKIVA